MLSRLYVGVVALALGCQTPAPAAPDAAVAVVPVTRLTLTDGEVMLTDPVVLAEPVRAPTHGHGTHARTAPCGGVDPHTGLMIPCFGGASEPPTPRRRHASSSGRRERCGHTDPRTGLIIPCFH